MSSYLPLHLTCRWTRLPWFQTRDCAFFCEDPDAAQQFKPEVVGALRGYQIVASVHHLISFLEPRDVQANGGVVGAFPGIARQLVLPNEVINRVTTELRIVARDTCASFQILNLIGEDT